MSFQAEREISINAPPEKVFAYVADLTRHGEWATRPVEIKMTSTGEPGVGSTYSSTGKQFGKHTDAVTIKEYAPGSRLVFESQGDAGHVRHWFDVAASGGGTRLKKGVDFVKPAFSAKLAMPVVKKVAPKDLEGCLANIKTKVEGGA
jgi:uncharacterized protein YndB with AHSA1/START domain